MKRSLGIDFVRAVSILLVMMRHTGFYTGFNYGYYAIEFLFVISGFLIGQILFNDFFSTPTIEVASVKRFMVRRWFRILPLYYFCILVKFAFVHDIGWNILYYVFFLQNHFYGIDFYPVSWTLVIDEWFYLGTPIMIYVFMRFISSKPVHILYCLISVIVVINLLRIAWVWVTNTPWGGITGNVPLRQDTLLIGVLLAFIKSKYRPVFDWMGKTKVFWSGIILLIGYVAVIYTIRYPEDHVDDYFWTRTISFTISSVLVMVTLPWLENSFPVSGHPAMKWFNSLIVWGSKLSYALYLTHAEIIHLLKKPFAYFHVPEWMAKYLFILVAIGVSFVLYKLIEKPMLILRDKYFPDRPHKITASVPIASAR